MVMKVWTATFLGLALLSAPATAQQPGQPAPVQVAPTPAVPPAAVPPVAQRVVRPAQVAAPAITPDERNVRFDVLDIDRNGLLAKEEWLPSVPEQMKPYADRIWTLMDAGSKGAVTREQYVSFRPQRPA